MHEASHLLHELHVAEAERDNALKAAEFRYQQVQEMTEQRDHARDLAVALEHQLQWVTPSWRRSPDLFPEPIGMAVYDSEGIA